MNEYKYLRIRIFKIENEAGKFYNSVIFLFLLFYFHTKLFFHHQYYLDPPYNPSKEARIISAARSTRVILRLEWWIQRHSKLSCHRREVEGRSLGWLSRGSTVKGDDLSEQSRDREWQGAEKRRGGQWWFNQTSRTNAPFPSLSRPEDRSPFPFRRRRRRRRRVVHGVLVSITLCSVPLSSCGYRVYTPRMTLVPPNGALRS